MQIFSRLRRFLSPSAGSSDLAEIARSGTALETCPVKRVSSPGLSDLPHPEQNPFRDWESMPVTVQHYALCNVVLDQPLMTLLHAGRPIPETAYVQSPDAVCALTLRPADMISCTPFKGLTASCVDHWASNYYHWVAHTIPTLHILSLQDKAVRLVLPEHMHPWQFETLELFGLTSDIHIRLQQGCQYAFKALDYITFVNGSADFAISDLSRAAYTRLRQAVGTTAKPAGRRLYIERGASANRHVPNESELADNLEKLGFERVRPETLSLTEQIRLFSEAEMVMGMLGAGMANIAWCQPGTLVYELVPSHHINPCFAAMATQSGLRYWADVFQTGTEQENHTDDASIPLPVADILDRVRDLIARLPWT
ncbi:glycosyltransferase family 61 protein [Gluconobacter cerevisiae]|uniref:Glycosyltransferase family 61 protein n=1 Tax=Gluconobacter cerevisiae TaxID=1379734 RepID=A0ABR9YFT0_9PROT|nr:glycosyltransferase family 61 protein [Gluconobacter cerevisiae]MBF0877524.1 glycosyltransferase family 61 protein [Gluconobacter cerevisiae]